MNELYLIIKNLTRNKLRMFLNMFAIMIAFLLYGALGSIQAAFDAGVELAADDRLVVVNKISFTQVMPVAYVNKVSALDGVKNVTWSNWFGGYYQDPKQQAITFIVDPASYLMVFPELALTEQEQRAWLGNRQGIVVGEQIAEKYGWSLGDKIPLSSNIFSHKDGGMTWPVVIEGIARDASGRTDTSYILMHHKYFFETQSYGGEWIGWITLTTDDVSLNETVSRAIDTLFANSSAETETSTEAAFNKSFVEQVGDIGLIIQSVILAAFFTILLIVGNSMMLTVRERSSEIAVFKTLGFPALRVFRMVLAESLLLALAGGIAGLLLAEFLVAAMAQTPQITKMFPNLGITADTRFIALSYIVGLGLLTGFFPALRALRLKTIDALAKG